MIFEKVNPCHPDKVADRIAGALVDYAYSKQNDPRIAVEVLLGHGVCHIIAESSVNIPVSFAKKTVSRIAGRMKVDLKSVPQDPHLSDNQAKGFRCGDNGIFKGTPLDDRETELSEIAKRIYADYPSDGKYVLTDNRLIVCQSNASSQELAEKLSKYNIPSIKNLKVSINPIGDWTGGPNVDSGATNRKLGSDMAQSVTGGGLHGKDLSKADVSVNIHAFLKAQKTRNVVYLSCAIGDQEVDGIPYSEIVEEAREFINRIGGFEKFAEWGLF